MLIAEKEAGILERNEAREVINLPPITEPTPQEVAPNG
jgi:hypothetical protein